MINQLLLLELNNLLGTSKSTARNNYSFICPFCKHSKHKLEICLDESSSNYQNYNCWVCGESGKSILSFIKKLELDQYKIEKFKPFINKSNKRLLHNVDKSLVNIELPSEFKTFTNVLDYNGYKALKYLLNRNITREDILKHNIGYCDFGKYSNRIIIPSYDSEGNINYFTARAFDNSYKKYLNPPLNRDIIPFEFFINWNLPIILCEGPFDAIAIKRNAIPLLGKNISSSLMKKIIDSKINKIYIALDSDAIKKSLEFCETLINLGKKIYLVELNKKDPSDLGFNNFTKIIHNTKLLSFNNLIEKKLNLI